MKRTVVRYRARPEHAQENVRFIENVFRELHAKSPDGVRYLVLKLADDTFIHFVTAETEDGTSPIPKLEAFRAFQDGIKARCMEPPESREAMIVGNYRVLTERTE